MLLRIIFIAIFLCVSSVSCLAEDSIIVVLDVQKGQQIIYIDGDIIEKENMYTVLAKSLNNKGRKRVVNVLFNPMLNFSEVVNTRGIIQAVGFSNIRFYFLSDDKKRMAEIEMNKPAIITPFDLKQ